MKPKLIMITGAVVSSCGISLIMYGTSGNAIIAIGMMAMLLGIIPVVAHIFWGCK
jgi:hypothetical protein